MSKTKRIKVLEEFIRLEKLEKNSRQDYIEVCEEAANKLKNELKAEGKSYRQRKIRLNKERRESLHKMLQRIFKKELELQLTLGSSQLKQQCIGVRNRNIGRQKFIL